MAVEENPGKLLFTSVVKDLSRKEYIRMGRAIQFRNSKKLFLYAIGAAVILIGLSVAITYFLLIIGLIVLLQIAVFFEYSSRNIASKIEERTPIEYRFHEDGLYEIINGESKYSTYSGVRFIKKTEYLYTLVYPKDIYVVPRTGLDKSSEDLMTKLCQKVSSRSKTHSHKKK